MTTNINEKTNIPLAWAASIVLAIVGVVFSAGITHQKFTALESEFEGYKATQSAQLRINQDSELKMQRLDLTLNNIKDAVDSIDRKLDRMEKP